MMRRGSQACAPFLVAWGHEVQGWGFLAAQELAARLCPMALLFATCRFATCEGSWPLQAEVSEGLSRHGEKQEFRKQAESHPHPGAALRLTDLLMQGPERRSECPHPPAARGPRTGMRFLWGLQCFGGAERWPDAPHRVPCSSGWLSGCSGV